MHDFKYSSWYSGWKASWAFWTLNIYCYNKLVRCYWFKIDILGNVGFANTEQLRNTFNPTRPRNNGKELALDLIPVVDTHLENISDIVFAKYFFLKNTNLKQIVRGNIIQHDKKVIRSSNKLNGKCSPCLFNTRTFYCKQIVSTPSFKSYQTKCRFKIFDNINCKKDLHIYLDAIYIKSIMLGNVRLP